MHGAFCWSDLKSRLVSTGGGFWDGPWSTNLSSRPGFTINYFCDLAKSYTISKPPFLIQKIGNGTNQVKLFFIPKSLRFVTHKTLPSFALSSMRV